MAEKKGLVSVAVMIMDMIKCPEPGPYALLAKKTEVGDVEIGWEGTYGNPQKIQCL